MAFDQSKFLARFVEEAREHCSRLNAGLLNMEKSPDDVELLNGLFRSAHTIKGSSKMMKLTGISELAHRIEDILDAMRGGRISASAPVSDSLFRGVDALSAMLERILAGDNSPDAPGPICQELAKTATMADDLKAPLFPAPGPAAVPLDDHKPVATEDLPPAGAIGPVADNLHKKMIAVEPQYTAAPEERGTELAASKSQQIDYVRINASKLDDLIRLMGEIVSEQGRFRRHIVRFREIERSTARYISSVAEMVSSNSNENQKLIETGIALQLSLRQSIRALQDASLMQDHLVGDLQETSLKLRMQPLSTVFDPLRRTVRDLAREQGKDIKFVVEGGETELDRKIIEMIGDSLMHMIRNALDHGLESAEERIAVGKTPQGTITLSAFYESGCVTIALSDDGRGLSVERIREKALSRRLFEPEVLAGMSKAEITNFIFIPGFSTSPIITDLSGRGVGMDVVRNSIVDGLKGTIELETSEGQGTTFLLRLPLNLAVFPLLVVSLNKHICALPATSVVEMLNVPRSEIIEIVNKRAIRLREQIIPVEELADLVRVPRDSTAGVDEVLIVIVREGEEKLGLLVDEIVAREEMVVKPLPLHLQNMRLVSGVTIWENHSIINILHVPDLLRRAREIAEPERGQHEARKERSTILVVDDSLNTREIEKSILEAYGYCVATAEDGIEAWDKTRHTLYDLVITDVEMPGLDGFSLTERLRGDDRYRNIPVIIVTSREKDADKKRGIAVGADAYIVKGAFDQSNLLETVRSLIG